VEFLRSRAPDNVLRFNFNGDWIATVETPGELISDAYYYYDVTTLKSIAEVLGKTADGQAYFRLANQIKDAFNRSFFDAKTAEYGGGTQTANAMALFLGLVPEEDRGSVSFYLERDLLDHHNNHFTTGIVGTKYLMPALTDTGPQRHGIRLGPTDDLSQLGIYDRKRSHHYLGTLAGQESGRHELA